MDHRLEIDEAGVCYAAPDGVLVAYPHPARGDGVTGGGSTAAADPRLQRCLHRPDPQAGHVFHFAVPAGNARDVALPLTAIIDRNGNRIELGYDAADGALAEITHSGRYRLVVETRQGLITAVTLRGRAGEPDTEVIRADGSQVTAQWNALRRPVVVVEPDGARWERSYDERGNLTAVVDPVGARTGFAYDDRGRLTAVTDALGQTRRVASDAAGLPVAVTDPLSAGFRLEHTPTRQDIDHHTLVLPKPVTADIAQAFNLLFGRSK